MSDLKPIVYDFAKEELTEQIIGFGEPAYRTGQIWQHLYKQLSVSPDEFSNLGKPLRSRLTENFCFEPVKVSKDLRSSDGQTNKLLFALQDGKQIEAVLMRYRERNTICISTQVGCPMNCAFCATGQMGFARNLSAGEIVGQVLYFARLLQQEQKKLTNIVVMGMGEPFRNYDSVMKAMDILNDPEGFGFGERRITISTVGLVPMIEKFAKAHRQINLAVSLHAPSNALRNQIMPVNHKYPIEDLLAVCKEYTEKTGRRITFEYALIRGFNDTYEDAALLGKRLKGMLCHVNLIPLNDTAKFSGSGSNHDRTESFRQALDKAGIPCSVRLKRGIDIGAGCGQLLAEEQK